MTGYASEYARFVSLKASSGSPDQEFYINTRTFNNQLSFRGITCTTVNVTFEVEGNQTVVLLNLTAHAYPDATYRLFDNGIVLANPSDNSYEFDLSKIAPGVGFKRIKATTQQDATTNNGSIVGEKVTLGLRDGLYLEKYNVNALKDISTGNNIGFQLFPNPCIDYITLQNTSNNEETYYDIFDISGKNISSGFLNSDVATIKTNFTKGMYLILLKNNKQTFYSKLIKK